MSTVHGPAEARTPLGDVAALLNADARWSGWPEPIVLSTTPTTMAEVSAQAADGAPEGTVVVAEEQTAGRGRIGRHWQSAPRAGLWLSILLRPACDPVSLGWLPLIAGTAVAQALREAGLDARLKWPNDVVVAEPGDVAKVAGVLAERLPDGAVILGVGINVDQTPSELPEGGVSLRMRSVQVDRTTLLAAVLGTVAAAYRAWTDGRDPAPAYRDLCVTLGSPVRVERPSGALTGQAVDLGEHGELIVQDAEGHSHVVSSGDVLLVRPPSDHAG